MNSNTSHGIKKVVSIITTSALMLGSFGLALGAAAPSAFANMSSSPTTNSATVIMANNATLNGTNGDSAATDSSFWVSTSTFSTATPTLPAGVYSTPDLGAIAATTSFSALLSSVSGLPAVMPDTTYYYAAWSYSGGMWHPGTIMQFTTAAHATSSAPVITSVSPSTGTIEGGTSVTIAGSGFTGATAVDFGSLPATGLIVNSDSSITVQSPATSTPGIVDISVMTPMGTSTSSAADHYTYQIGGTVTGGVIPGGVLSVDSIVPVHTSGTADGTYADGWSYIFNITVPTTEPNLSMKFSDWLDANSDLLPVAGNMRISSAQASDSAPVTITAANTYSSPALDMVGSVSTSTPGLHVQVLVEVKIPLTTINGSYTTNYGVQTLP